MRAAPVLPALVALIAMMAITPAFAAGVDQNRLDRTVLPEHFGALPFSPWPLEPVAAVSRDADPAGASRLPPEGQHPGGGKGRPRPVDGLPARHLHPAARFHLPCPLRRRPSLWHRLGVRRQPSRSGKARPRRKVYLFDRQDTGLCAVWVAHWRSETFFSPGPAARPALITVEARAGEGCAEGIFAIRT